MAYLVFNVIHLFLRVRSQFNHTSNFRRLLITQLNFSQVNPNYTSLKVTLDQQQNYETPSQSSKVHLFN